MKSLFKIFVMIFVLAAPMACSNLMFGVGNLIGGGLQSSPATVEDPDLILDENDAELMEEGPLPIPVTMSKLDPIDARRLVISSSPYETASKGLWLREAMAQSSEDCVAGEVCVVSVRGLAGAVRDPESTPYVLLYADDDQSVFVASAADGSFENVDLLLTLNETTETTDVVLIVGMTDDDLTTGIATYPTYFAVTSSGNVAYTQTNTNGTISDGILFVDEFGNSYYVVGDDQNLSDLWRQDSAGSVPILILENAEETVIDVIAIGENQVLVFFENGSTQSVEIQGSQAIVHPPFFLRQALAGAESGRTTRDGLLILDPVEIFDFSDYDFVAAKFFPYKDVGFIVSIEPIPDAGAQTGMLAAYVSLDGDDVRILVPFDPEDVEAPKQAYLAFTDAYFYVLALFDNLGSKRTEFSRMPVAEDLDTTFNDAWSHREVLFPEMNQTPLDLDANGGVFVFTARNVMNDPEMILWQEGDSELSLIWNFAIQSGIDPMPGLSGGVELSPNGKFLLACSHVGEAPEGVEQSEELKALVSTGAHVFAHRIDVDAPGEFHEILDHVALKSCPDGMQITDDYLLRYYSFATDSLPAQMSFIDLKTLPLFEGLTDD